MWNTGYIGNGRIGLWVMGWLLVMAGAGIGEARDLGLEARHGGHRVVGEVVQDSGVGGEVNLADDEVKERGVLFAWALAMVLGGFFVVMFTVAMARSGRFFRRRYRIGVKEKPTEYIDAWSQYRLKDADWQEGDEDEE